MWKDNIFFQFFQICEKQIFHSVLQQKVVMNCRFYSVLFAFEAAALSSRKTEISAGMRNIRKNNTMHLSSCPDPSHYWLTASTLVIYTGRNRYCNTLFAAAVLQLKGVVWQECRFSSLDLINFLCSCFVLQLKRKLHLSKFY